MEMLLKKEIGTAKVILKAIPQIGVAFRAVAFGEAGRLRKRAVSERKLG
jgi:hypothetical protein